MARKVCIVGSSTFPIDTAIGAEVVDVMRAYGPGVVFLTRNGSTGFDRFVATAALTMGVRCLTFRAAGGADNFARDDELVAACDEMVAFIDPGALDDHSRGTTRLMERALHARKPVRAATAVDGSLVWAEG